MIKIKIKELKIKKYSIFDTIAITIKLCPMPALAILVLSIICGIVPSIQILVIAEFLDQAVLLVDGQILFMDLFILMIAIIILIAISWLANIMKSLFSTKLQLKLRQTLRILITRKKANLKYHYFENADTWDLISRVSTDVEKKYQKFYIQFFDFVALCFSIIGLICILLSQMWQAAIVILIVAIPLFILSLKSGEENYKAKIETEKYHRRHEYLGEILLGRESAQERSLFHYGNQVSDMWHHYYEKARIIEFRTKAKWFVRSKTGGVLTTIISVIVTLCLIHPVMQNLITIGMFISLVNATYSLVNTMTWSLSSYVEQIANMREYMKEFEQFVGLEEIEVRSNKQVGVFESIEFKDVKFKYPGTDNYILNGFTYQFNHGIHYALVGTNGAGKTTIIKLLTGLYHEYEGEILLNGRELREYSQKDLSSVVATMYQDYARYQISLKDNIVIGDLDECHNITEEMLDSICEKVGFNGTLVDLEYETKLGKIYEDGKELSGGQWQKIALARILISKAPVCILDEPTAALDPISECHLYQNFNEISAEKTVILVSHRLGSTKLANRILVLNDGCLTEEGTHEQLIEMNGIYCNMYESQRSWYNE